MKRIELRTGKAEIAAVFFAFAALVFSGCGIQKGNLSASIAQSIAAAEGPDMEMHKDIRLNFDEAQDSLEDLLEDYELGNYVDTFVDEEQKVVTLIWPLKPEATEEDGVEYAEAIIRAFNDACREQDFSIKESGEEFYGGMYETYDVNVQVFREQDILSPEAYLVSMTIPAGSHENVVAFSEYDGMNQVMMTDGPTLVPGGKYSGATDKK